ncbi:DUF4131 domain-containing protein, partial [Candidatus Saccharibacteria bacterium]|nr:DUF4131 domain-containing protein [Candidatus Saccharibacteria bacterium]
MNIKSWWRKTIHPSFLIAWVSIGILLGIGCSLFLPVFHAGLAFISIFLLIIIFTKRRVYMFILAIIAGLILGLWRGEAEIAQLSLAQQFYNQPVVISGKVVEDVSVGKKKEKQLRLKNVAINNQKVQGQFWVTAQTNLEIKRSDTVTAKGKMKEGFGNFNGSISFAKIIKVERMKGE